MLKVKFKKLHKDAVIPKVATKDAACVDVIATEIKQDGPFRIVYLGFSTEIPKGYKMCIAPRSSFTQKGWVMQNSPAQIDSDYRGEWMVKFEAIPVEVNEGTSIFLYEYFPYKVGERCAQCWLEKVEEFEFEEVEELSNTDRGDGGFGHTGN